MRLRHVLALLLGTALTLGGITVSAVRADDDAPAEEQPPAPAVLVEYRRSGGFAGFNDHLVINSDGQVTLTRRASEVSFTLAPGELANLIAILDAADFPALAPEYRTLGLVADGFSYAMTYRDITVKTETLAEPDVLKPVIRALDAIIAAAPR